MGVLLEVKDLVTHFHTQEGTVYAVNGVSYTLNEGETLGVVGESGSGKSVHVLSMLGLIPRPPGRIENGEVIFNGRDLLKLSEKELRKVRGAEIGMIFQDPMTSLNPVLTIGRQLTEALKLHLGMNTTQARARATELLDIVGIPNAGRRLDDYPHQFSGGMRQRVMIAIGLSCNPRLLIADEPTTALDVTIQAQIVELVKQLKEHLGMAMIWITHDLGVVAGLADTVQVMYAGRIVERGPVESVFKDPRSAYTLGLIKSLPRPDMPRGTRLEQIPGAPPDMLNKPVGDPFAPRNPYATPRCCEETPPLRPVPDGHPDHYVAAWYDLREARALEARTAEEAA
ncbi:MAG: ABC transporter ATP-binding protein [Chloroflexaceae bacterium]|nr:ABC transporter ATP-binding protein [Chloroflexaceae bacterium]